MDILKARRHQNNLIGQKTVKEQNGLESIKKLDGLTSDMIMASSSAKSRSILERKLTNSKARLTGTGQVSSR